MRRLVLVGVVLVAALVVLLPLRLALGVLGLDRAGISARGSSGSVWAGHIEQLGVGGVPLGTVEAALSPLALLTGRARLDLRRDGAIDDRLAGAIDISRTSLALDDATTSLPVAGRLGALPIAALDLTGVSVRFDAGSCARARGRVHARLSGDVAGLGLAGGLTGAATCDGALLLLPLASQSGRERIDLRIGGGGSWTADLIAAEPGADLVPMLERAGFARVPGGYRLRASGTLR